MTKLAGAAEQDGGVIFGAAKGADALIAGQAGAAVLSVLDAAEVVSELLGRRQRTHEFRRAPELVTSREGQEHQSDDRR